MNEAEFDFAIFGSTPMAQLLAGLLSGEHGRRVLLVGQNRSGYRLPRGLDLSVAPITRPQSWAMLGRTSAETARLVTRIAGRNALSRVDPVFFAEAPRAGEALSHMKHMAVGFGIAAEPMGQSMLGGNRSGMVLRDALRLNRPQLETGLERWLKDCSVHRLVPHAVTVGSDGAVNIEIEGTTIKAHQAVLADDEAIIGWLPLRQWPTLFQRTQHTSILTTPTRPLAATIMLELDKGLFLTQQAEGGVAAFGPGEMSAFSRHLQSLLGQNRQVEQAGQTGYPALATRDGAPAFGRAGGLGADIVANTGCYGAFISPAIARWLAGRATADEARWFEQHLVNRTGSERPVDEFHWPVGGRAA